MRRNPAGHDYSICAIRSVTLPSGRTYPTPAGNFPSITTILGKTGPEKPALDAWRKRLGDAEADRQSKFATDRGTLVHAYVEHYLKIDVDDDVSIDNWTAAAWAAMKDGDVTLEMARNLRQAVRPHIEDIWTQETPLWSPTLKVAGCVDFIGLWDGVPFCVDWKTSRKPKLKEWIGDYELQVTAYALMHDELFGTQIEHYAIVVTCENGDVQIFEGDTAARRDELIERVSSYYSSLPEHNGTRQAA